MIISMHSSELMDPSASLSTAGVRVRIRHVAICVRMFAKRIDGASQTLSHYLSHFTVVQREKL
jgi:hypothetical protein